MKRKYLNGTCEIVSTPTGNGTIRNDDDYIVSDGYVHSVTMNGANIGNYGTLGCALRAAKGDVCERCREQGEKDAEARPIIAGTIGEVKEPAKPKRKAPRKKKPADG